MPATNLGRRIAHLAVANEPTGDIITLTVHLFADDPKSAFCEWHDHTTGEIREQSVNTPNTSTWRDTTKRRMQSLDPNFHTPAFLIPKPNRRKAPYA